jgi:hypothetical protein
MSEFLSLAQAAGRFGYSSGPSMRKAFERKHLPSDCLLRIGQRGIRIDVGRLTVWLREQQAQGRTR